MSKEMLINVSAGEECRIALLEDGKLEELYMERASATSHVGNIYKGRVTNVEPSIQAAFVDFGLGRNGFLHISDLQPSYFGRKGEDFTEKVGQKISRRDRPPIQRCLRRGDDITVQIIKEGIGTKGPTLSTYLSVPGRILVMMPGMSKFGISKKIEDEDERRRIRDILDTLKIPTDEVGFIVRTAGVGKTKAEIDRDLKYLLRLWDVIQKKGKEDAPQELYTEGDLVTRTVRDVFTSDVEQIIVDNKDTARKIKEFFKIAMPRTKNKVELYEDPMPLFHKYKIEPEIEKMYSRHVPLPSGGSLVIDQTEAVVAIDVNSGKFRDHSDAETTAFKTDMEAADEIPRQLRLRDLGGVIICDFIDLRFERHRRELEQKLHDNLRNDRAKTKVLRMSQFGIIEMTRQRMRPSLKRSIYQDCPHCKGAGLVKTPESMSIDVMRRMQIAACNPKVARVELTVGTEVAFYLLNRKRSELTELERECEKRIIVKAEIGMALDELKLELFDDRDGMVYLSELGVLPPSQLKQQHRQGGRNDRRGGRNDRNRNQDEDSVDRDDLGDGEGAAAETPPEKESNVIDIEDAPEEMGEAPRGMDDDRDNRNRRGGRGGRNQNRGGRNDNRRGGQSGQAARNAPREDGDADTAIEPRRDNRNNNRNDNRNNNRGDNRNDNRNQGGRNDNRGDQRDVRRDDRAAGSNQRGGQPLRDQPRRDVGQRDIVRGDQGRVDQPRGDQRRGGQPPRPQRVVQPKPFHDTMPSGNEGLLPDPEAPDIGNEKPIDVDPNGNGGDVKKKRRRRGGRRHRARRERAAARAAAEAAGVPYVETADDIADREEDAQEAAIDAMTSVESPSNDVEDVVENDVEEVVEKVEAKVVTKPARKSSPRRVPPAARTPQPPVVKTGSTDKHLADDEPVDPLPTSRRPRSRIDLDEIPDDFD